MSLPLTSNHQKFRGVGTAAEAEAPAALRHPSAVPTPSGAIRTSRKAAAGYRRSSYGPAPRRAAPSVTRGTDGSARLLDRRLRGAAQNWGNDATATRSPCRSSCLPPLSGMHRLVKLCSQCGYERTQLTDRTTGTLRVVRIGLLLVIEYLRCRRNCGPWRGTTAYAPCVVAIRAHALTPSISSFVRPMFLDPVQWHGSSALNAETAAWCLDVPRSGARCWRSTISAPPISGHCGGSPV